MNNASNLKVKEAATPVQKSQFTKDELGALAKVIQDAKARTAVTKSHHCDGLGALCYHR